jgi:cellobiose-specific phosphotransferase system component IIB
MKKIDIKLGKKFKDFCNKIKPKSSKNLKKKNISIINEVLFGMIKGQKVFLNTIVKNTEHYQNSLKDFKN